MFRLTKLKPPHGWNTVAWDLGIVTVGVLIALGAQQAVESVHSHASARQAEHAIQAELARQEVDAMERLAVQPCLSGQLKALATKLSAFLGGLWQGVPMIVNQKTDRDAQQRAVIAAYRAPERLWVGEAWQTARSNGSLDSLPDATVSTYAQEYNRGDRILALQMQENEPAASLAPLAIDGPISADERASLLGAIAAVDRANAGMAYQARYLVAELRPPLTEVPAAKIDRDVAAMVADERRFRGTCVETPKP
jgi:hypothetical protein